MKSFWKTVGAVVVGLLLFGFIQGIFTLITMVTFMTAFTADTEVTLKDNTVYQLKLTGALVDYSAKEDLSSFYSAISEKLGDVEAELSIADIRRSLEIAAQDKHVKALYLDCNTLMASPASCEEVRKLILKFKTESKKPVIAYADNYTQSAYWIASVADKIYMNPEGLVGLTGVTLNTMFMHEALEKLGIKMQVVKVGTFKSAVEPYLLDEMSEPNRLQLTRMGEGIWNVMLADIAAGRKQPVDSIRRYADEGHYFDGASVAVEMGIVDSLVYRQDMKQLFKNIAGGKPEMVKMAKMLDVKYTPKSSGNKIAVLYAMGDIDGGDDKGIVSEKFIKQINKLAEDEKVKAVVLRINSLGGSAYGSEQMWYAESKLKAKKPLIVSMGDYAASGGYYMSCVADYIVADPTTLTGSIGIFGVFPCIEGTLDKVGIHFDGVKTSPYADLGNITRPLNDSERAILQNYINRGYDLFTRRCADGRGLSQDSIKVIGEGRVWLGVDAMNIGLVDKLGTLEDAIAVAAEKAGLKDNYAVSEYPEKEDIFEELVKAFSNTDDDEIETRIAARYPLLAPYIRQFRTLQSYTGVQALCPYQIIL